MIVNEQLFELEDQVLALSRAIIASTYYQTYQAAKANVAASTTVSDKQAAFTAAKVAFEKVADYGTYAPEYKEKQRALYRAKRALDLQEEVAAFRVAQTQLQELLDQVGLTIAATVSPAIKVAAGSPFFTTEHSCTHGGGCHRSK